MGTTTVVSRENIASWAPDSEKLYLFRRAVEAMQEISDTALMDERGYQWVAGVHGGFGGLPYCHHGDLNFITWHRPYVLDLELKLRAQIATIADQAAADEWRLPYWDWAAEGVVGLPEAFTAETYEDHGTTKPNPLLSRPYRLSYPVTGIAQPHDRTWRDPGALEDLQELRSQVQAALQEPNFNYFSSAIEQPHNGLHLWVGGFMITFRSSFDPIFWVHHCNIDRHFWLWQQDAGDMASIPQAVRDFECQPFDFRDIRAAAFFDTRTLGYTYAQARSLVVPADEAWTPEAEEPGPVRLDFGALPATFERIRLNLHGVRHPEDTCELRVYANRDDTPDSSTPKRPDDNLVTSYVLLGHGDCPGAPGHCDPELATGTDLRQPHHLAPFDVYLDVTGSMRRLASGANGRFEVQARIVVLDSQGLQIPSATLMFDNATLTVS